MKLQSQAGVNANDHSLGYWPAWIWLAVVSAILLIPQPVADWLDLDSRLIQALAFGVFGFVLTVTSTPTRWRATIPVLFAGFAPTSLRIGAAVLFAAELEVAQTYVHREPRLEDFLINFLSILVGGAFAYTGIAQRLTSRLSRDPSARKDGKSDPIRLAGVSNPIVKADGHASRFVFIAGLHASGTSALCQTVGTHPDVSIFRNTGAWEDEGQHLQSIYPRDEALGGPGLFGLDPAAHITETSPLVLHARTYLPESWMPYWDLSKKVLVEKSPANITRSRFLQTCFPDLSFIFVMRHPTANLLATLKFNHEMPLLAVMQNWLACHRIMLEDLPHLGRYLIVRYEDLCHNPQTAAWEIERFMGLGAGINTGLLKSRLNEQYLRAWRTGDYRLWAAAGSMRAQVKAYRNRAEIRYIEEHFEAQINQFGYSFRIYQWAEPPPRP